MTLRISCPHCGKSYQLRDDFAGRRVRCLTCAQGFKVPAEEVLDELPLDEPDALPPRAPARPARASDAGGFCELRPRIAVGQVLAAGGLTLLVAALGGGGIILLNQSQREKQANAQRQLMAQTPFAGWPGMEVPPDPPVVGPGFGDQPGIGQHPFADWQGPGFAPNAPPGTGVMGGQVPQFPQDDPFADAPGIPAPGTPTPAAPAPAAGVSSIPAAPPGALGPAVAVEGLSFQPPKDYLAGPKVEIPANALNGLPVPMRGYTWMHPYEPSQGMISMQLMDYPPGTALEPEYATGYVSGFLPSLGQSLGATGVHSLPGDQVTLAAGTFDRIPFEGTTEDPAEPLRGVILVGMVDSKVVALIAFCSARKEAADLIVLEAAIHTLSSQGP